MKHAHGLRIDAGGHSIRLLHLIHNSPAAVLDIYVQLLHLRPRMQMPGLVVDADGKRCIGSIVGTGVGPCEFPVAA